MPPPVSPGEVLRNEILAGTDIRQEDLAKAMGVSRFSVNQIINERRDVTAEMAVRLSIALGTSPEFWLNLQRDVDIYRAHRKLASEISSIRNLRPATRQDEVLAPLEELVGQE